MRRVVGFFALATLVVSASGLSLAGAGLPAAPNPILKVKKVVAGTATAGFTVTVECDFSNGELSAQDLPDPDATLTFNADGTPNTSSDPNWQNVAGNWQFQGPTFAEKCTVTETGRGGAVSASYACEFTPGLVLTDVSQQDGTGGCSAPASGPAVVTFSGGYYCDKVNGCAQGSALVTITNAFPAITVGPTASVPGGTVTISGTQCNLVTPTALGGIVTGTVAFTPPLPFGPVTAAADGTWSTTIVVPAGTPAGSYAVNATCAEPPGSAEVSAQAVNFTYETKYITIAIPATPKFTG
ncbi:MAG: hypothetical protein R6X23_08940 [Acidimicrobiia bacterium]